MRFEEKLKMSNEQGLLTIYKSALFCTVYGLSASIFSKKIKHYKLMEVVSKKHGNYTQLGFPTMALPKIADLFVSAGLTTLTDFETYLQSSYPTEWATEELPVPVAPREVSVSESRVLQLEQELLALQLHLLTPMDALLFLTDLKKRIQKQNKLPE